MTTESKPPATRKPKGNQSKFTIEQQEQLRAYNREAKARKRALASQNGLCLTCAAKPVIVGTNSRTGKPYVTCQACSAARVARERALGWRVRPSRAERKLAKQLPLAREILEAAGAPLSTESLLEKMKARLGFSDYSPQALFNALVEVSPGVWGLMDRDVPLSPIEINVVCEDAWASLRPGELVPARELKQRLVMLGSPEAERIGAVLLRAILRRDPRFICRGTEGIALAEPHPASASG